MQSTIRTINVLIAIIYLWIGFVCAISFMEAWLKFRAEGVTLPIGLSIGRLVFFALNKVEIFMAILTLLLWYILKTKKVDTQHLWVLLIPIIILFLQTTYLLPVLDGRAKMIIEHNIAPPSNTHIYYVCAEFIKITTLFWAGTKAFKILKFNH